MSLVLENVIIRIEDCHCLAKPVITRIIVSLVLENVVVRAAVSAVLFSEIL